jgi:hypothetical protein
MRQQALILWAVLHQSLEATGALVELLSHRLALLHEAEMTPVVEKDCFRALDRKGCLQRDPCVLVCANR